MHMLRLSPQIGKHNQSGLNLNHSGHSRFGPGHKFGKRAIHQVAGDIGSYVEELKVLVVGGGGEGTRDRPK
jgi:uridylate kinase